MGGFANHRPNAPITGINVTPLVDITLVLLIIFMVTAKLVVSRAVPLDLPKAATGGELQQVFALSLRADGSVLVNGAPASRDEDVLSRAHAALEQAPELRAVVRADGAVPHRQVMHALDVLRQAGVSRVAFAVEPGPPTASTAAP